MHWLAYAPAALFALLGLGCLLLVLLGLPGLWLMLALAVAVELIPGSVHFGWEVIAGCAGLGVAGEVIEAVAGAAGTRFGGGGRRGMIGAFAGGIAGALVGTALVPIPIVGTLVGALAGSFAGAWYGEATAPEARGRAHNLRAAFGAALGKLGGTLGKLALAVVAWVLLVRAAFQF